MAKELVTLKWIEELLPKTYLRKPMFGGFAYYVDGRMVLALFESEGDRTYKKQTFHFDLWNGCLFPTERVHHAEILKKFPFLMTHPILSKWLYLPLQTEDFDNNTGEVLKEIRRKSEFFGIIPKPKKSKKRTGSSKKTTRIDTRKPRMFSKKND